MLFMKRYKIRSYEMGLLFRDGEFRGLVEAGTHWFFDPLGNVRVESFRSVSRAWSTSSST